MNIVIDSHQKLWNCILSQLVSIESQRNFYTRKNPCYWFSIYVQYIYSRLNYLILVNWYKTVNIKLSLLTTTEKIDSFVTEGSLKLVIAS